MKTPDPVTAEELSKVAMSLPISANCLLPNCSRKVRFRGMGRGRLQQFCSGACRASYSRERAKLRELWLRLEWTAGFLDPPRPEAEIHRVQRHVAWLLEQYGGLDPSDPELHPEPPRLSLLLAFRRMDGNLPEDDPEWLAHKRQYDDFNRGRAELSWPYPP